MKLKAMKKSQIDYVVEKTLRMYDRPMLNTHNRMAHDVCVLE